MDIELDGFFQDTNNSIFNGKKEIPTPKCLHKQCTQCHGTGRKDDNSPCHHFISCPCPRCTPTYQSSQDCPEGYKCEKGVGIPNK